MDNTKTTLVSVVVVAYQSEKFILEVLESIKAQTWKNIELIIADDDSTDNTVKICIEWLNTNKDRFIHTDIITVARNTGIPANCNRGLKSSNGEWIKFIGADDILFENCIEENMNIVKQNTEISFVISDLIEINEKGKILRTSPENEGLKYFMKNQQNKERQLKAYARWPAFLNTPTFFYKRDLLDGVFSSDQFLRIFEDTSAMFNIISKNPKIHYFKKPTVKYRIHENAISRNREYYENRERESYLIYIKYRKEYLSPLNPIDISVFYENWLRFKFQGIKGHKGITLLRKLSLFYWHLKINGIKT